MDNFENQINNNKQYKYKGTRQQIEMKNCFDKLGIDEICKKTGESKDKIDKYTLGEKKVPDRLYNFIADSFNTLTSNVMLLQVLFVAMSITRETSIPP